MKVGIAGAGAIALGYAALLISRGYTACLWSPSGTTTADLREGHAFESERRNRGQFHPYVFRNAAELTQNDVIVLALPAYGQRFVIDALVQLLEPRHSVIISGHLSFAALYLAERLSARGQLNNLAKSTGCGIQSRCAQMIAKSTRKHPGKPCNV